MGYGAVLLLVCARRACYRAYHTGGRHKVAGNDHGPDRNLLRHQHHTPDARRGVSDNGRLRLCLNEDGTYSNKKGDAIDKTEMSQQLPAVVNVYDMQGRLVKTNVKAGESLNGLPRGLYIVGGKKMLK